MCQNFFGVLVTFHERLRAERLRLQLSQERFAQLAGVSNRSQANYENGDRKPQVDYLEALEAAGVDTFFVVTGRRQAEASDEAGSGTVQDPQGPDTCGLVSGISTADTSGLCALPMYDIEAAAGDGRALEAEEIETTLYFPSEQLAAQGLDPDHVVGVKVRGDSMETTLTDGDWVLVDRKDRPDRPEGVFLLLVEGERRIKRVQRVAGGAWVLISDNSHYQAEMIPPEKVGNVVVLGRCVVRIGRIS
ncbi:XRE family transcriptional regulator [Halomonas denitrificans]|uniref:XRE family transcriptional regulator n=1 Tax=Halomonas denitrificans TaxID=370769 RepID=UPI0021BD541A|nr:LexA family transcriptional regulator [Halomonas denitrificans]